MTPGSTDIVVDVPPVDSTYTAKMPDRQFRGGGAKLEVILKQAQDNILHKMLGIGAGLGGELRKLPMPYHVGVPFM
jgi:hypothetical protein